MSVVKKSDADWRYYLRQLAESQHKISDIEKVEFAGYLMRRDSEKGAAGSQDFIKMISFDNCYLMDYISAYMIAESPESIEDLLKNIQHIIVEYYSDEMDSLIKQEEAFLAGELKQNKENPKDEFCYDDEVAL